MTRNERPAPLRPETGATSDRLSLALLTLVAVLILFTFRSYGISNDEEVQQRYGELLIAYYRSGFAIHDAFTYKDLFYYGGFFDMVAVALERALPLDIPETRHLLSAVIGWSGIVGVWQLARHLAGPRAALIATALITITGAWYGAMFNHTKDIPFAAFLAWSLYFTCRLMAELPRPGWASVVGFGVATGLALAMRVGGGIAFVYAAIGIGAWLALRLRHQPIRSVIGMGANVTVRLMPAAVIAFVLMAIFWPWAVQDPLNVWRALVHFADFHTSFQTVLDGVMMPVYAVPGSYLPVYLAIKLPELVLIGLLSASACGLLTIWSWIRRGGRAFEPSGHTIGLALTAIAAFLPVILFIITDPPAYDGVRHFLFLLPPLMVLAGIGLDRAITNLGIWFRHGERLAAMVIAGAVALQALLLVRLHPYEYVNYNMLVGGVRGAEDLFVMDYWANTVPEATRALSAYLEKENHGQPDKHVYTVGVCADRWSFSAVAPPDLHLTRDWPKADFFIAPTHMRCDDALHGKIVYEVKRLGATLAVVKDRRGIVPPVVGRNDVPTLTPAPPSPPPARGKTG